MEKRKPTEIGSKNQQEAKARGHEQMNTERILKI